MARGDYRFAWSPRWLAGHALALVGIVVFVQLGLWQLRRLDERRDLNAVVTTRLADGYRPLAELIAAYGTGSGDLEWRPVEVSGSYLPDEEVIVQGRSYRGQSGHHVATPLVLEDGSGVIVNRGWVPIDVVGPPVVGAEPPAGSVTVRGVVRTTQTRGSIGPRDPATGMLERVARIDVARLQQQSAIALFEFYVDLMEQTPAQPGAGPLPVDPPEEGEGPHLSYAIQWFTFAAVVIVGYPLLLRRNAGAAPGPAYRDP